MDYNKSLYLRLVELGMLEGDVASPKYIGECNECQVQAVRFLGTQKPGARLVAVRLATTINGSEYGENTILVDPDNNSLAWISKTMPYEFCEPGLADETYDLLVSHLDGLLATHGDLIQGDSLRSPLLCEKYWDSASVDCESINDEPFETREHIFHIRFSCGDMFIAADGNAADPSSCYFFDKDDNSDFGDCPYFDEICSDLELGLEM